MKEKPKPQKYTVYVDDNFHYMDESKRTILGEFANEEEALAAARKLVDDFLADLETEGKSSEELYKTYVEFGEDPWISGVTFSAWDYAKQRCREIASLK
jgi:hypothetical protein